jgi:dTMP kinase
VCDRFTDATYAYQGGGHGVAHDVIAALEREVLGDFRPDLTLVFDVPSEVGLARLADGRPLDKFERKDAAFFDRVRSVYLERAQADPQRCRVIDSTAPRETVAGMVANILAAM